MAARSKRFYRVRVAILSFVLFVVVLYAIRDFRRRGARNEWQRPVEVAIVLVHVEGTTAAEDAAVQAFRDRASALRDRLSVEARRHGAIAPPFQIKVHGPIDVTSPAPAPASDGLVDLARQAMNLRSWTSEADARAGVDADQFDTRIYVAIRRPVSAAVSFVEGLSEQNGHVGTVSVDLDPSMADFALFVVAHELFHTVGASDKYDAAGHARDPEGLAEPSLSPRYPQRFAEIMARSRPVAPGREEVPDSLDQLAVGDLTAKEIGWTR